MTIWGINALNHDAGIAVMSAGQVVFNKRSSEYSNIPGDNYLNHNIIKDALDRGIPNKIVWYENPWSKKLRQIRSGQWSDAINLREIPRLYLNKFNFPHYPIEYASHHGSHAAYAIHESKFKDCVVLVADAIGEWDTLTVWHYNGRLKKLHANRYPWSLGLFYSAMTEVAGFIPCKEESRLTELSSQGDSERYYKQVVSYLARNNHRGIWDMEIPEHDRADFAASVQRVFEEQIEKFSSPFSSMSNNIVFTGGCAFNQRSHRILKSYFKNIFVPKNPSDSNSALGAIYYNNIGF